MGPNTLGPGQRVVGWGCTWNLSGGVHPGNEEARKVTLLLKMIIEEETNFSSPSDGQVCLADMSMIIWEVMRAQQGGAQAMDILVWLESYKQDVRYD